MVGKTRLQKSIAFNFSLQKRISLICFPVAIFKSLIKFKMEKRETTSALILMMHPSTEMMPSLSTTRITLFTMNKDGTTGDQLVSKGTGQNVSNGTGIGAVSAMALSAPAGTTFDFEFIDDPENTNSGEGVRSPGDRYASNSNLDGGVTFFMNEAMFESGLDITNGDVMPIAQTEVERSSPTPATIGDTVDGDVSGTLEHDAEGGVWILDVAGGAYKTGDWAAIMGARPARRLSMAQACSQFPRQV